MKLQVFKHSVLLLFLLGISIGYSQQSDKKVDKFKVEANPTLVVNASHTDVTIEAWNKKEIQIVATIEIEGATKEQAQTILDSWNYKATGNSEHVEVESFGNVFVHQMDDDYKYEFVIPEMVIEIPEIEMPEIEIVIPEFEFEMPEIVIPEFVFEIPEMEIEFEEFDYDAYEKDTAYLKKYKTKVAKQVKEFKASGFQQKMDSLRNSKEYKEQMKALKEVHKKAAKQVKAIKESEEFQKAIMASKEVMVQVKEQMKVAQKEILKQREIVEKQRVEVQQAREKMKINMKNVNIKNPSIRIKRNLNIKAPKDTKYNLKVKHGKLDVPETAVKMSARVSYGNFIAGSLSGNETEIVVSNSPVVVNAMKAGNITLKNVPNAVFGTFSNAHLFSDSSEILVEEVGENASMSQKFGFLEIDNFSSGFQSFNLILDYAKAVLDVSDSSFQYLINGKNSTFNYSENFKATNAKKDGSRYQLSGNYGASNSNNTLNITGVYSTLTMN